MHQLLARDGVNIAKINIFSHKRKKSNIFLQAIKKTQHSVLQYHVNTILHSTKSMNVKHNPSLARRW